MSGFCKIVSAEDAIAPTTKQEFQELMERVDAGELKVATFAGGCFWCTESFFLEEEGVIATQVGYTGGHVENPTYEQVGAKKTGHAEGLQVIYDPEKTDYNKMLTYFFDSHDPTQLNRQGPDIGPQYRGAIFYHDDEQKSLAEAKIKEIEASGKYDDPLVTELNPAVEFYRAEEYHQRYYKVKGLDLDSVKKLKGY